MDYLKPQLTHTLQILPLCHFPLTHSLRATRRAGVYSLGLHYETPAQRVVCNTAKLAWNMAPIGFSILNLVHMTGTVADVFVKFLLKLD